MERLPTTVKSAISRSTMIHSILSTPLQRTTSEQETILDIGPTRSQGGTPSPNIATEECKLTIKPEI